MQEMIGVTFSLQIAWYSNNKLVHKMLLAQRGDEWKTLYLRNAFKFLIETKDGKYNKRTHINLSKDRNNY